MELRHHRTTVAPKRVDLFVVTLVANPKDGRRVALNPITDYDAALARVRAFHRDNPCQIKVLPMTVEELFNLLGLTRPERSQSSNAYLDQLTINRLKQIMRDSPDDDARADALALLPTSNCQGVA